MKKSFSILEILIFAVSLILLLSAYVMNIDNAGLLIGIILIIVLGIMTVSGNVAPKLPYNRHIGLRLPWTTHDENTWKAANNYWDI